MIATIADWPPVGIGLWGFMWGLYAGWMAANAHRDSVDRKRK